MMYIHVYYINMCINDSVYIQSKISLNEGHSVLILYTTWL